METGQEKMAFVKMIQDNTGIIKSLCRLYYTNSQDQEDISQDIILAIWKSYHRFKGKSSISTWIYKVSLYTILNDKRAQKSNNQQLIDLDSYTDELSYQNHDDDVQLLRTLISQLNDLDKSVVILYLEGYRHSEIGDILGWSLTNVTTRLFRIKTLLRKHYKNLENESR